MLAKWFAGTLVLALTAGSLGGTPARTDAQPALIPSSTSVQVGGSGMQVVSVSILGARRALTGTQLYYVPDPFDQVTGLFSLAQTVAIGPAVGASATSSWVAPTNSTKEGVFALGQSLVFGLWMPNNTWLFSGGINAQSIRLHAMLNLRAVSSGSLQPLSITAVGP